MTTRYLDKYFENQTFYKIQSQSIIDNPDQRIVDDLNSFSGSALGFALSLFNAIVNLLSFSGILYGIYAPLFYVLLVYSIGGTALSVALGKVSTSAPMMILKHLYVRALSLALSLARSLALVFVVLCLSANPPPPQKRKIP